MKRAWCLVPVVVGLVACGGGGPPRSAVSVSGSGMEQSDPITLEGDYAVTVQGTDTGSQNVGCYNGITLKGLDDGAYDMLANELVEGGQTATSRTNVYGLARGRYVIDASSGCTWSVQFVPR